MSREKNPRNGHDHFARGRIRRIQHVINLLNGSAPLSWPRYNYFPNRDALLDAVSAEIFSQFKTPARSEVWQEWLRKWIFALYDLFERYPVAAQLIRWNRRVSPAWLRIWLPVIRMLAANGLAE